MRAIGVQSVAMSFGRNPFAAKAEAAEQKAENARDAIAREQAWRDAARNWDRAAQREKDDKRRQQYADKAEVARTQADGPQADGPQTEPLQADASEAVAPPASKAAKTPFLN
jgi:hypothetical protein